MKNLFTMLIAVLLLAVPAMAQQGPLAPDTPEGEQEQFSRVQVNVTVSDASGVAMQRLLVQAQSVSLGVSQSLTDKDGKCGMTLRPGAWVIKVSRNLDVLLRLEIEIGETESLDLPLTIGANDNAANGDAGGTQRFSDDLLTRRIAPNDRSTRISAGSLDRTGAQAAAELALFTDPVIREARQKILDQYVAKKYSTSYWMEQNVRDSSSSSSERDYRLDWDWQGNVVGAGGSSSGSRPSFSLFGTSNALVNVPVNVNIEVSTNRVNQYRGMYDFGNTGSLPNATNPNSVINRLSERVGGFLTGGSQSPESPRGFDLGSRAALSAQSNTSFRAFYNEINNHIVNLYRPLRAAYGQAVGPTDAIRGVEFVVEKTFIYGLKAKVLYSYSEAGGLNIRTVDFYFEDWQDFETFLEQGVRRDINTTLEARFSETGTRLAANYRMYISDLEDVGFSDRVSDLVSEHSRIDVSLNQKMNFGFLSSARISFSFAVNNLLNQTRSNFLSPDALEEDLNARKYLGGIRIEF